MSTIINTHHRTLNRLEGQAVEMVLRNRPFQHHEVMFSLGTENGVPFVAIQRGADAVLIHFEESHSTKDEPPVKVTQQVKVKDEEPDEGEPEAEDSEDGEQVTPAAPKPKAAAKPKAAPRKVTGRQARRAVRRTK